jgi:hypothetical protein
MFFRFDNHKFCYLNVYCDDLKNYSEKSFYEASTSGKFILEPYEKTKQLIDRRLSANPHENILFINVLNDIGRGFPLIPINPSENDNCITEFISFESLFAFIQKFDFNNLDLWRFLAAKKDLSKKVQIICNEFTDIYEQYLANQHSFYFNEELPAMSIVTSEATEKFITDVREFENIKFLSFSQQKTILTKNRTLYKSKAAIAIDKFGLVNIPNICLKDFSVPIWLSFNGETYTKFTPIVHCIDFWLYEMKEDLNKAILSCVKRQRTKRKIRPC